MDNRALLRAAGFVSDAFTALNLQRSKLKDEPRPRRTTSTISSGLSIRSRRSAPS